MSRNREVSGCCRAFAHLGGLTTGQDVWSLAVGKVTPTPGPISASPCETRRAELLAQHTDAPVSLALYLGARLVDATGDLPKVVGRLALAAAGNGQTVIAYSEPGTETATGEASLRRRLAECLHSPIYCFLQTMHYTVWVGFLPRYAPDATAAFEARVPWLRGGRAWTLAGCVAAVLAVLFVSDYVQGRTLYAAFASYYACLEFPVLLALLLGRR